MRLARESNMKDSRQAVPIDLDQSCLNIENRTRTSLLPWRGQFSPELIEHIIERVCPHSRTLLDPFCGSGTVLFEALRKGMSAFGAEVNPAAWHLASLASFAALPREEKNALLQKLRGTTLEYGFIRPLEVTTRSQTTGSFLDFIAAESDELAAKALAAVLLLGMGDTPDLTPDAIARGGFAVSTLLGAFKEVQGTAECLLADARSLPLADESIDAAITSPPYINVFNYHQNYRPAVELLGWAPLRAAPSEIGANRKHRANRFLTVVQYSLDMAQSLAELSRVMETGAPLVIILGRTSNVLGVSFRNGRILENLIKHCPGFSFIQSAERLFTNRYGEQIYEDILIARRVGRSEADLSHARQVSATQLVNGLDSVSEKNRSSLEAAIAAASGVQPSPYLLLSIPEHFLPSNQMRTIVHAGS